ncbi:MAG: SHOCT domain-containing protein [Terriglobales bacterium]
MALAAVQAYAGWGWWWIWWIVWVVIIILAFAWWTPLGGRTRIYRETPLEVLRRRLASGEISVQEYEQKRTILLRDRLDRGPTSGKAA